MTFFTVMLLLASGAMPWPSSCAARQERLEIGNDRVIDGDHIGVEFEIGNRVMTEVRLEYECIVARAKQGQAPS
ncbi:MAG TPA: hypothetical protein VKB89_10460 [Xanthobacteraceae bacterium]|nr:hypothetical protein [Xanthobacteraceae bacterium]